MFIQLLRVVWSILLLCAALGLCAQGFNKRYDAFGQGYAQGAYGLERSSSGHVIFSFSYEPDTIGPDSVVGGYIIILHGLDEGGNLQWQKRYRRPLHGVYLGWADCCDTVPGGGYVVGGSSEQYWTGVGEARVVRFNAQGDSLWSRSFGSPGHYWIGQQVKHLDDGGFVICGGTDATGYQDGFLIRMDAEGNELWRQTYGWPDPVYIDGLTSVEESADGDLFMSGSRFLGLEEGQHWVQRTSPDGLVRWQVDWGGPYKEGATYLSLLSDDFPLVAGASGYATEYAQMRPYLAKIDTLDGSRFWEHEYGEAFFSTGFFAAKECPNTDIIACGVTYEGGNEQGLLLRATGDGDSLWMRNYSYYDEVIDSCRGRFWDVLTTQDGGFIMSGFANGPFNGPYPPGYSQDAWVVKVDSMGCVVPGCDGVGVTEIITNMQGALTVFPSPAHGQVQVQIDLPITMRNKQDLQLSLMNATGQLVAQQAAFEGNNTISLSTIAAGLYHVHLTNGRTWLAGTKLVVE